MVYCLLCEYDEKKKSEYDNLLNQQKVIFLKITAEKKNSCNDTQPPEGQLKLLTEK